jgi:hypothetical protein
MNISCVDFGKKCNYGSLINFKKFASQNTPTKPEDVNKMVCEGQNGKPYICCNKNDPSLQQITSSNPSDPNYFPPVKIKYGINGNIEEIITCPSQSCQGYKQPTNYEACKVTIPNMVKSITGKEMVIKEEEMVKDCFDRNCDNKEGFSVSFSYQPPYYLRYFCLGFIISLIICFIIWFFLIKKKNGYS